MIVEGAEQSRWLAWWCLVGLGGLAACGGGDSLGPIANLGLSGDAAQASGGQKAAAGSAAVGGSAGRAGQSASSDAWSEPGATGTGGARNGSGASAAGSAQGSGGGNASGGGVGSGGGKASGGGVGSGGGKASGGGVGSGGGKASGGGVGSGGGKASGGGVGSGGGKASGGGVGSGGGKASGGGVGSGGTVVSGGASSGSVQNGAVGYGKAATGGGSSTPLEVSSREALQAAIDAYSGSGGLVLKYTGKFNYSQISDPCVQHTLEAQKIEIKKKSDITLLGADGSSANFGIHVAASSSNIIIRNMTIGLLPGGSDSDIISLEGMSGGVPTNVWIDHNELFSSMAECPGAGDTAFDGMIDIKKGADNVTISYNYMHDHHKVSLNGYSDDDDTARHVTFHHNVFENVGSRTPLQRHGYAHLFNNYFHSVTVSGINVRMSGYALIEGNYFENVKNPVTSRDSDEVGFWDLRNNNLATAADVGSGNAFGITWDDGNSGTVNATDWKTTAAFPVALGYSYGVDSFACVKSGLRAVVGAGKGLSTLKCQ